MKVINCLNVFAYICAALFWALLLMVIPEVGSKPARLEAASCSLNNLVVPTLIHRIDCGVWPIGEFGTESLVRDPKVPGWKGPYVKEGMTVDSWGRPFRITAESNGTFRVMSAGEDGIIGTPDDIYKEVQRTALPDLAVQ